VTQQSLDWLPSNAFGDSRIADLIDQSVQLWSKRWFARVGFGPSQLTTHKRGSRAATGKVVWKSYDSGMAVGLAEGAHNALARMALDGRKDNTGLLSTDQSLLNKYANAILNDLVSAIVEALAIKPKDARAMTGSFDDGDYLEINLKSGAAGTVVKIAMPTNAIVPLRKSFAQSQARSNPAPVPMSALIEAERLAVRSVLGSAVMSVAEVRSLGIGDVIVLDTMLDDPVELISRKSGQMFAAAQISQNGDAMRLTACKASGARL
jgi:flagellar motor switch/type III secretory pathway protein FliN